MVMKRKNILKALILSVVALVSMAGFTSCYPDEENEWWGNPPYGWDTFNDTRLSGYWMLVQYNSDPVYPDRANYLFFNGDGYGYYYYMENGMRYRENMRYWCQDAVSGASNYQINIQCEYSTPLTTSHWFTHGGNTLWMQWTTGGGRVQTYVYDRIGGAPW